MIKILTNCNFKRYKFIYNKNIKPTFDVVVIMRNMECLKKKPTNF